MYNNQNSIRSAFLLLLIVFSFRSSAQQDPLTAGERKQVIDSIIKKLERVYIYPEMARKMNEAIALNANRGNYDAITDPATLAARLREDLVTVSHDRHLNISFDPGWVTASKKVLTRRDSLDLINKDFPNARADNFGFKEIKILDGNIGYLNLTKFYDPALGGETAAAAMNLLANTDALIIDLRYNGGGYGDMVQLIASYLFDSEPVLIVDIYSREGDQHRQDWTLPYVPGKRMPEKPVYLLTSSATFSAAESFTYFLQNRKRATIIGETTGGGAHPIHHLALTDRFTIFLPYGRPIDPVTGTDWENTGVKPDINVAPKEALLAAQITALERLLATDPENSPASWALAPLEARQHPVEIPHETLRSYAGSYSAGQRKLFLKNGQLFFQRTGQPPYALLPLAKDLFMVEEIPYLRIQMHVEKGAVIGFTRLYNDGSRFKETRDKGQ